MLSSYSQSASREQGTADPALTLGSRWERLLTRGSSPVAHHSLRLFLRAHHLWRVLLSLITCRSLTCGHPLSRHGSARGDPTNRGRDLACRTPPAGTPPIGKSALAISPPRSPLITSRFGGTRVCQLMSDIEESARSPHHPARWYVERRDELNCCERRGFIDVMSASRGLGGARVGR